MEIGISAGFRSVQNVARTWHIALDPMERFGDARIIRAAQGQGRIGDDGASLAEMPGIRRGAGDITSKSYVVIKKE